MTTQVVFYCGHSSGIGNKMIRNSYGGRVVDVLKVKVAEGVCLSIQTTDHWWPLHDQLGQGLLDLGIELTIAAGKS